MTWLTVTRGPGQGARIALEPEGSCVFGTDADCDLSLTGDGVAPRHGVIKPLKQGGFGVKALDGDLELNGKELAVAARLQPGDRIRLGADQELHFGPEIEVEPERILGGFRLIEELGAGGMGTVYRAEQVSLHREVALKVLSRELTDDPVFVAGFLAEARAAARLQHPNVVQVYDVDHEDQTYFYSMELMHDGSLEDLLRRRGRLSVERAIACMRDAAQGLSYAESLRIVHRDIKPDNLMVDTHGVVKIADLGLAQSAEETAGKVVGTAHFMSPEQALRKPLDHRSDLYSLGCTFYRLVTGKAPFKRPSVKEILRAQVREEAPRADEVVDDVPHEVGDVIARLMAKDPATRYQNAGELIADLDELATAPSAEGSKAGLWIGVVTVLVVAIAATIFLTQREPEQIIQTVTDPAAAEALATAREREAEIAFLKVEMQDELGPVARADALDAMAVEFEGTEKAKEARAKAESLRASAARTAAAERQLQERATETSEQLRADFDRLLSADDLAGAEARLAASGADTTIAQLEPLASLRGRLAGALSRRAGEELDRLHQDLARRLGGDDPDALAQALAALEQALQPESDLLRIAAVERSAYTSSLQMARDRVRELSSAAEAEAETSAWSQRGRMLGDAVLPALTRFDLPAARGALTGIGVEGPAELAADLRIEALRAALQDTAPLDGAQFADTTPVAMDRSNASELPVRALALAESGLRVQRADGSERVLTSEAIGSQLADLIAARPETAERVALVALHAWARHLQAAARYLSTLDPQDPDSGTGDGSYPLTTEDLRRAESLLSATSAPWAGPLLEELQTLRRLVVALHDLSLGLAEGAAGELATLLAERAETLTIASLR